MNYNYNKEDNPVPQTPYISAGQQAEPQSSAMARSLVAAEQITNTLELSIGRLIDKLAPVMGIAPPDNKAERPGPIANISSPLMSWLDKHEAQLVHLIAGLEATIKRLEI